MGKTAGFVLQRPYFEGSETNLKNVCLLHQWRATEHFNVEKQHISAVQE